MEAEESRARDYKRGCSRRERGEESSSVSSLSGRSFYAKDFVRGTIKGGVLGEREVGVEFCSSCRVEVLRKQFREVGEMQHTS